MTAILEVTDLVKRYGDFVALDHLNLKVQEGEIFGLLGPNGSGKTTAIFSILSLLSFDKGEVKLWGQKMHPTAYDLKARIGIVPQQLALFRDLTVREQIDTFCHLYVKDTKKRRELVEEAIRFCGLQKFQKFQMKKLSGGLQRRLNIACGIVHQPELLFMDEPTVAVDAQSRQFILEGIKKLQSQGTTVIYSTHYLEEAEMLCDRIAILDQGEKIAEGTLPELKSMIQTSEIIELEMPEIPADFLEAVQKLPRLVSAEQEGSRFTMSFASGGQPISAILHLLDERDLPYTSIHSTQPSLNEVFLALTGKDLRE